MCLRELISIEGRLMFFAAESILISFLCLLTPYLLRVWLSDLVNVPGGRQPGKALSVWVYAVAGLCTVSILCELIWKGQAYWVFAKVGDAITFFPVIRTMKIYSGVTTPGGNYAGRGSLLSQLIVVVEYYSLIAQLADIVVKSLILLGVIVDVKKHAVILSALYGHTTIAIFTRVLCHSVLLNTLDESAHFHMSKPEQQGGVPSDRESPGDDSSADSTGSSRVEHLALIPKV
uniref:Uncharacterized protein n=1 Tax=Grammatophora oceanica TaxID=210454 RepID=A0A7S1UXN3_9STRA|mmetsp:Transcript_28628/g.42184  ORF Transcript_28628/g.42184 Transcript_28628/m.42184 type:complete len:232 (+) Transcript_28628:371-1066(+)